MKKINMIDIIGYTLLSLCSLILLAIFFAIVIEVNPSLRTRIKKPYRYNEWQNYISNVSKFKDLNGRTYYLFHEYRYNGYIVLLETRKSCMDCWTASVKDHPYRMNRYIDPKYSNELGQAIIKQFGLTWENTHGAGEIEDKCLYHRLFN